MKPSLSGMLVLSLLLVLWPLCGSGPPASYLSYAVSCSGDEAAHELLCSFDHERIIAGIQLESVGPVVRIDSHLIGIRLGTVAAVGTLKPSGLIRTAISPYHRSLSTGATRTEIKANEQPDPLSAVVPIPFGIGSCRGFYTVDQMSNTLGVVGTLSDESMRYELLCMSEYGIGQAESSFLVLPAFSQNKRTVAALRVSSDGKQVLDGDVQLLFSGSPYSRTKTLISIDSHGDFDPFLLSFSQKSIAGGFDQAVEIDRQLSVISTIGGEVEVAEGCTAALSFQQYEYQQDLHSGLQKAVHTLKGKLRFSTKGATFTHISTHSFTSEHAMSSRSRIQEYSSFSLASEQVYLRGSLTMRYEQGRWCCSRSISTGVRIGSLKITAALSGSDRPAGRITLQYENRGYEGTVAIKAEELQCDIQIPLPLDELPTD